MGRGSAPAIPWIELTALEAARELGSAARRLPTADVCDGSGEIVVELEVAGFAPEALSVEVHNRTLVVRGERPECGDKGSRRHRLHERLVLRFERHVALPLDTDTERVRAAFANGLLTIRAPLVGGAEIATRSVPIVVSPG